MTEEAVTTTALPLPLLSRGKVRDVYSIGEDLLIVATDRISAFDHILPTPVPGKGRVLTMLSAFWFEQTEAIIPNHMVEMEPSRMPPEISSHARGLEGRCMLARRARRIDLECVVRGYLAGSGWAEYGESGSVCGIRLPRGLHKGSELPEPIFTPATKASSGHDRNVAFDEAALLVGGEAAERLRRTALALYAHARSHALARGLVLADTKFEFGTVTGPGGEEIILIDEALTPDSSRYWDAGAHARGEIVSFDKQHVRDYLNRTGWNHEPPAPPLPEEVVEATRERYLETYRRLTGKEIA